MYELLFLVEPQISKEQTEPILQKIETAIQGADGEIVAGGLWSRRKLAIRIKKINEGVYYLYYFNAQVDLIQKLHDMIRLEHNILLNQIVKIPSKFIKNIKIWPQENRFETPGAAEETPISDSEQVPSESEMKSVEQGESAPEAAVKTAVEEPEQKAKEGEDGES